MAPPLPRLLLCRGIAATYSVQQCALKVHEDCVQPSSFLVLGRSSHRDATAAQAAKHDKRSSRDHCRELRGVLVWNTGHRRWWESTLVGASTHPSRVMLSVYVDLFGESLRNPSAEQL